MSLPLMLSVSQDQQKPLKPITLPLIFKFLQSYELGIGYSQEQAQPGKGGELALVLLWVDSS